MSHVIWMNCGYKHNIEFETKTKKTYQSENKINFSEKFLSFQTSWQLS